MSEAQVERSGAETGAEARRTRWYGIAAASGFGLLVVLVAVLAVTEENLAGTAAGVVGIATGVLLGLWLVRTEPAPPEAPGGDEARAGRAEEVRAP